MSRPIAICLLTSLVMGCEVPDQMRLADMQLRFTGATSCRPTDGVDRVVVEALGDFGAADGRTIEILRPRDEPGVIDSFPPHTQMLLVTASSPRWEGTAVRFAPGAQTDGGMLLVPPDRECALADPLLATQGARLVPSPSGGLFLVGGFRDAVGTQRVLHLAPGEVLADRFDDLEVPRMGAAAAHLGNTLLVAGGVPSESARAHADFEVLNFQGEHQGRYALLGARVDGAMAVVGGKLFLIGGREQLGGEAIRRTELLHPDGRVEEMAPLPQPRAALSVVVTDDGAILAIGGEASNGNAVGDVFAYDVGRDRWETMEDVRLPALPGLGAAALPGGRVVVWASDHPARGSNELTLLQRVPPWLDISVTRQDVVLDMPRLTNVRATPLPDGRLLMHGLDGGTPRTFAIDFSRGEAEELTTSGVSEQLAVLADGLVYGEGALGASVRRPVTLVPFHQPPATLLAEDLVFDGLDRWETEGTSLIALRGGARADIPSLRFASFRVEMTVQGEMELLLRPEGRPPVRVFVGPAEFGPALCGIARRDGDRVQIIREGDRVTLAIDDASGGELKRTCRVEGLGERVGLGVRAPRSGSRVTSLSVTRL